MADTNFAMMGEADDLPRTLRREKEARERAKREEEARKRNATLTHDYDANQRTAMRFNFIDCFLALNFAFLINAAILIMAAAAFNRHGLAAVAEIQSAYQTLSPLLGIPMASLLFALALLCSGQNSTLTGTLAGQIVMEGFLDLRLAPWLRRLLTRGIAIVPAIITVVFYGEHGTARLLILSQVILSLQLSFAVVPLVQFTSDRRVMGEYTNPLWLKTLAWTTAAVIIGLNALLLVQVAGIWRG